MLILQTPINYIVASFTLTLLILVKRSPKSPIEGLISNKNREFVEFSVINSSKLTEEYNNIKRNIKYWSLKSKNSKFIVYFRFIKFYEFLLKQIALRIDTSFERNHIEMKKAISVLQSSGFLKLHEFNFIDKQRRLRNSFIHDLGLNFNTNEMKSDICRSLENLNIILSRIFKKVNSDNHNIN